MHWAARGGHAAAVAAITRTPGVDLDAADAHGHTPLHVAAALGHAGVVQELWAKGACIDPPDCFGWRPLHYATRHGHGAVSAHLIIAGSHVQAYDDDGLTAGHLAAERGYVEILDKLLIAGFLPDAAAAPFGGPEEGGTTALHLAAMQGNEEAVRVLLRWSADAKAVDALGCSPLDCALLAGHLTMAPLLLSAGSGMRCPGVLENQDGEGGGEDDKNDGRKREGGKKKQYATSATATSSSTSTYDDDSEESSLSSTPRRAAVAAVAGPGIDLPDVMAAALHGPTPPSDNLCRLLECLASPDPTRHPLFTHPSIDPSQPVFRDLFDADVSFAALAAAGGLLHVLKALKQRQEDPCKPLACDMNQAMVLSVRAGRTETVKWLVAPEGGGCTPESCGDHALLHHAAFMGHVDVVRVLLDAGWNPGQEHCGTTPLQEAVACGHENIVAILLAHPGARGPALLNGDRRGYTALHTAAASGSVELVFSILEASRQDPLPPSPLVDATLSNGRKPAHLAAKNGHLAVLHALLDAGTVLSDADARGWTPLHFFAERGDLAAFVLLYDRTAPLITPASRAALLTASVHGGSPEMVGALLTGPFKVTPQDCVEAGETPVHAAAREGFLESLDFLDHAGFDLQAKDEEGRTPLHHVPTGFGHLKSNNGNNGGGGGGGNSNSNSSSNGGGSLLYNVQQRHDDFVAATDMLLCGGCRADDPDTHSCTPVHIAAGCGSSEILQRLIELAPATLNACDEIGWTPLFWAANEGHGTFFTTTTFLSITRMNECRDDDISCTVAFLLSFSSGRR